MKTEYKKCYLCALEKESTQFNSYYDTRKHLHIFKLICVDCEKEKIKLKQQNLKRCECCKDIKNFNEFDNRGKNGVRRYCRACYFNIHKYDKKFWRKDNPIKSKLQYIRCEARKKGIPFNLTVDDIEIPEECPILGIKLEYNRGQKHSSDNSPSLDRLIPERGYIKGNVNVISNRANRIKSNGTAEELERIAKWMREQGCK